MFSQVKIFALLPELYVFTGKKVYGWLGEGTQMLSKESLFHGENSLQWQTDFLDFVVIFPCEHNYSSTR